MHYLEIFGLTKKKILTREEEADEIIRRLQTPPKKLPRTLTATWTIESLKDLSSHHGIDLESEIAAALSVSIAEEIDTELLKSYYKK